MNKKEKKKNHYVERKKGHEGGRANVHQAHYFLLFSIFLGNHTLLASTSTPFDITRNQGLPSSVLRCSKCQGPRTTASQHMAAGH